MTFTKLAAAAIVASSAAMANAETFNLTLATGLPPLVPVNKTADSTFVPSVNAYLESIGSEHRVNWTVGHAGTIVKLPAIFEAVSEGLVDIGVTTQALEAGAIPLMNVSFYTPFGTSDHRLASVALDEVNEKFPEMKDAWVDNDLRYLTSWSFDSYVLVSKEPINSLKDLDGMKVGGIGPNLKWVTVAGAVGVVANYATAYSDLQSGVMDAMLVTPMGASATRLHEVAPYVVDTGFGAIPVNIVVFNEDRFASLPEDVQEAISHGMKEWEEAYMQLVDVGFQAGIDIMVKGGGELITWDEQAQKGWADALPALGKDWAAEMQQKGLPGYEVLETYMTYMRDHGASYARDWDQK